MSHRCAVLVVDDHPIVACGIAALVRDDGISVEVAVDGATAIALAANVKSILALVDLRLPDLAAPDVIRRIRLASPETRCLLFTTYASNADVAEARRAGAARAILKDSNTAALVRVLRDVCEGAVDRTSRRLLDSGSIAYGGPPLTDREFDVLQRVALGESNAEVARVLHLAPNTVKTYWQRVMQKLGVHNRVAAVACAHRAGII